MKYLSSTLCYLHSISLLRMTALSTCMSTVFCFVEVLRNWSIIWATVNTELTEVAPSSILSHWKASIFIPMPENFNWHFRSVLFSSLFYFHSVVRYFATLNTIKWTDIIAAFRSFLRVRWNRTFDLYTMQAVWFRPWMGLFCILDWAVENKLSR